MTIHYEWNENISVGNEKIDAQHKKLLTHINKIMDAVVYGVDSKEVKEKTVEFLGEYVQKHFSYEEEYMKENNYPDIKITSHIAPKLNHLGSKKPNIIEGLNFYFQNR